jgi:RimJ/RimL family protein N-acetyltransferase
MSSDPKKRDNFGSVINPGEVVLRSLTVDDVSERYVGWLNDPETNRYLEVRFGVPHTVESVRSFVRDCFESGRVHLGIFVAGNHVGNVTCSLDHANRHSTIAFLIGEVEYRGVGLAKLAISGALSHLFENLGIHRVEASAYANHAASLGLMKTLGFQQEGIMRDRFIFEGEYVDDVAVAVLDHEWRELSQKYPPIKVIDTLSH